LLRLRRAWSYRVFFLVSIELALEVFDPFIDGRLGVLESLLEILFYYGQIVWISHQ